MYGCTRYGNFWKTNKRRQELRAQVGTPIAAMDRLATGPDVDTVLNTLNLSISNFKDRTSSNSSYEEQLCVAICAQASERAASR
jgi:hypothetical protein